MSNGISGQLQGMWASLEECRSTRALLICMTLFLLLGMLVPSSAALFAMVPAHTFNVHHYIWNLATAGLFETSFFMGLLNISVAAVVCPVLERAWGSANFFKFVAIVNVACNLSILLLTIAMFAVTENDRYLFARICGFSGINAAFAIALKQRFADRPVLNYSALSFFKIKHIPMVISALAIVLWSIGRMGGKESPLVLFGVFYSWLYLRYYFTDFDTGIVGDLRDEFAFDTLFPSVFKIRSFVAALSVICLKACLAIGCCKDTYKNGSNQQSYLPVTTHESSFDADDTTTHHQPTAAAPTSRPDQSPFTYNALLDPTAERRRAMAIRAIDAKLAELNRQAALQQAGAVAASGAAAAQAAGVSGSTHHHANSSGSVPIPTPDAVSVPITASTTTGAAN